MFKRICKITFIAHGATVYSMDGIINSNPKYPKLNDFGEEEIERVCEYLKKREVSYDKIYTCPSSYCIQTANIIAKLFKQKATTINLAQRNFGSWNGSFYMDLFKEYGSNALAQTPENGESLVEFNKRISKEIDKLIKDNKGTRIIVVATPEIIQSAIAKALSIKPENQHKTLIKTGSLTQISYFEDWSSVIYSGYLPL